MSGGNKVIKFILFLAVSLSVPALLLSCGRKKDNAMPQDTLVAVGKDYLTRSEVMRALPGGLSEDDSTAFVRTYVRSWIDGRLIDKVATEQVNMAEINKLVDAYRSELIMTYYRRAMAQTRQGEMSEDSVKAYYDAHSGDFKLERPLLKGIYLKIPDDSPELPVLRKLYKSDRQQDMDKLEKAALNSALHYDYFMDRWIDWEQIETRIPEAFYGYEKELRNKKTLDLHHDGFVYLLSIRDFLPAGATMPFEAAEPLVRERLLNGIRTRYDRQLRQDLLDKSISDGTVVFPGQNPLK